MPPEGSDLVFDHRHNADERVFYHRVRRAHRQFRARKTASAIGVCRVSARLCTSLWASPLLRALILTWLTGLWGRGRTVLCSPEDQPMPGAYPPSREHPGLAADGADGV